MLHDERSRGNAITVADVFYAQAHPIARPELAVQTEIKQCKFSRSAAKLKSYATGPNILELERGLLTDDPFPYSTEFLQMNASGLPCCSPKVRGRLTLDCSPKLSIYGGESVTFRLNDLAGNG